MKSAYFIIHLGKTPPPQNGCRLKYALFLKAPVSYPPLSHFNRTFHKSNRPPLHKIPVLPGHLSLSLSLHFQAFSMKNRLLILFCLISVLRANFQLPTLFVDYDLRWPAVISDVKIWCGVFCSCIFRWRFKAR